MEKTETNDEEKKRRKRKRPLQTSKHLNFVKKTKKSATVGIIPSAPSATATTKTNDKKKTRKHKMLPPTAKHPNFSKKAKKPGVVVNIPSTASECGSNWKKLLTELDTEKTRKDDKKKSLDKDKFKRINEKNSKEERPEIWFDGVDEEDILHADEDLTKKHPSVEGSLVKQNAHSGLTKAVGIDCEMVGTRNKGSHSVLARVSIVNQFGKCIYDKHVKPEERVTDYRTWVSGIRPSDLVGAEDFVTVQREVAEILKGRILVGHALRNDLSVLYLTHPKKLIRDTADYKLFRETNNGRPPALRNLCKHILGIQVQKGEHSSVQDAQAAMRLYTLHKKQWEKELKLNRAPAK